MMRIEGLRKWSDRIVDRIRAALGFRPYAHERKLARRVKTPTVLQMEAVECGAASLANVLTYYGRIVPLEELREACGVSRDGSKASNMLKAARRYGLIAKGFKREPESLRYDSAPMIIHWNFNHFLVLEGFRKDRVYLNDPAIGPRVVSAREFDESFTGVVLTFEPGPAFEKGGSKRSLFTALKSRLHGSSSAVFFVVAAGLALVLPGLVIPTFSKIFVDDILVGGSRAWIRPLLLAMGLTATAVAVLTWLQQSYLLRLETKLAASTSGRFFWHVLRLPFKFFTQRFGGEIGSRVGINDRVARMLSAELATTMLSCVLVVFYALLMIQYDTLLTLIGIAVAGLNIVALRYVARKRKDANQRLLQEKGKLLGVAMGGLQTIETLKASGAESDFFTRWAGYHAKTINAQQQLGLFSQVLAVVPPLLLGVNVALILGVGALRIMDGHMSMGMLVAFQTLMLSFVKPVNDLVAMGGKYQEVEGDMGRIDDVLLYDPERREDAETALTSMTAGVSGSHHAETSASASGKLDGVLELHDVTFGYSPLEPPLIEGLSLRLDPGARVALVGGSGSGKSTVAKLVCGLFEPWSGVVAFDGIPRSRIPLVRLHSSFAFVDQEIFLFEGTIRQNLTLWDDTISEVDVVRAAKDASIHEVIAARSKGYGSPIEEGGRNFSGGQRQRLEIARALAGNPSILVLDEATSALDAATEQIIDDHLRRRACTTLIVAHRLSTIRDADEIIVLDNGRVAQRGSHDTLVSRGGLYEQLMQKH